MSEIELEPCPFCGNARVRLEQNAYDAWYVHCTNCGAGGPLSPVCNRNFAVDSWNRRTVDVAELERMTKRLEDLAKVSRAQFVDVLAGKDDDRKQDRVTCPYCHEGQAVKVWFPGDYRWADDVTTDQHNGDCRCNMYVCPSCGRVSLLDAPREKSNGEKVVE